MLAGYIFAWSNPLLTPPQYDPKFQQRRTLAQKFSKTYRDIVQRTTGIATALISPSAPYRHDQQQQPQQQQQQPQHQQPQHQHQHHDSPSPANSHSAPATSIPGMISPVEPLRPLDDSEAGYTHWQSLPSLPSILEVFSEKKPLGYAPPPPSAPLPPPQSLPSPFTSFPPTHPFADLGSWDKNPSPRTLIPSSSTFSLLDSLLVFADPVLPALASRPIPPPLNTFPGHHASPPIQLKQVEAEHRYAEAQSLSAGPRTPPPADPLFSLNAETGRLPPRQLPPSAYPISPRHSAGPRLPSSYEARESPNGYGEEADYSPHCASDYKAAFDKHFQTNGY